LILPQAVAVALEISYPEERLGHALVAQGGKLPASQNIRNKPKYTITEITPPTKQDGWSIPFPMTWKGSSSRSIGIRQKGFCLPLACAVVRDIASFHPAGRIAKRHFTQFLNS